MEVRDLVGMVLEPLYKMPGSVVVAVWEGNGGGIAGGVEQGYGGLGWEVWGFEMGLKLVMR